MEELFSMTQKELSIYDLLIKVEEKRISQLKGSELLEISDRHFRRHDNAQIILMNFQFQIQINTLLVILLLSHDKG